MLVPLWQLSSPVQVKVTYPGAKGEGGGSKENHGKEEGREEPLLDTHAPVQDLRGALLMPGQGTPSKPAASPLGTCQRVTPMAKFLSRLWLCRKLLAVL